MTTSFAAPRAQRSGASKVPEVTVLFWVVKVLTTGAGETTSDFLVRLIDPVVAVGACFLVLAAALAVQLAVRRYRPWLYWGVVALVSVFGTMVADVAHTGVGIPYAVSAAGFALLLASVFLLWKQGEGNLSIHSITTRRRELYYWATVLATFALGTATGDLLASTLRLGYLASGLFFVTVIVIPALGYRLGQLNAVFAFWFAYVVTRPLGASFADWMGVGPDRGGLGWGTGWVSLGLGILIVVFVAILQAGCRRRDPVKSLRSGAVRWDSTPHPKE